LAAALRSVFPSVCAKAARSTGLELLIVGDAPPNADKIAFALGFRDDLLRSLDRHSSDCREELPLIGMRIEVGVDEHAVARLARRKLQGSAIRFPNAPLGIVSWLGKKRS